MNAQEFVTLLMVIPAGYYLCRRAYRSLFGGRGACGSCQACEVKKTGALYTLPGLNKPEK